MISVIFPCLDGMFNYKMSCEKIFIRHYYTARGPTHKTTMVDSDGLCTLSSVHATGCYGRRLYSPSSPRVLEHLKQLIA